MNFELHKPIHALHFKDYYYQNNQTKPNSIYLELDKIGGYEKIIKILGHLQPNYKVSQQLVGRFNGKSFIISCKNGSIRIDAVLGFDTKEFIEAFHQIIMAQKN